MQRAVVTIINLVTSCFVMLAGQFTVAPKFGQARSCMVNTPFSYIALQKGGTTGPTAQ